MVERERASSYSVLAQEKLGIDRRTLAFENPFFRTF